jgi:hypothetical protein
MPPSRAGSFQAALLARRCAIVACTYNPPVFDDDGTTFAAGTVGPFGDGVGDAEEVEVPVGSDGAPPDAGTGAASGSGLAEAVAAGLEDDGTGEDENEGDGDGGTVTGLLGATVE